VYIPEGKERSEEGKLVKRDNYSRDGENLAMRTIIRSEEG
jgi:hypothetical protein